MIRTAVARIAQALRQYAFVPVPPVHGLFAPNPGISCHIATFGGLLGVVRAPTAPDAAINAALLEQLRYAPCGFDIDQGGRLEHLSAIGELTILFAPLAADGRRLLEASGFSDKGDVWRCLETSCAAPQGGAAWGGAVYPALGHVAAPPNPPWTTRAVRGFYVTARPDGVPAAHRLRDHDFVHEGVATRPILHRQLVVVLDPTTESWPAWDAALAALLETPMG